MKLIVGLGNPGAKYERTRHNVGFIVLDQMVQKFGFAWQGRKFDAEWTRGVLLGQDSLFLKPQTFMNLSGKSIAQAMRFYKIKPQDLVIVYDDVDVPFSKVKTRMGGGAGGHNGIRSTIDEVGTDAFARIKIGVGRPLVPQMEISSWVLGEFSTDEMKDIEAKALDEVLLRLQGIFLQNAGKSG